METCSVSCKRYTSNQNSSARKNKRNRLMILSNVLFVARKNGLLLKNKERHSFA